MTGEYRIVTDIKNHKQHLIRKCSRGPDGQLVCDKNSDLGHVQMCRPVANQPHLHRQKEVPGCI